MRADRHGNSRNLIQRRPSNRIAGRSHCPMAALGSPPVRPAAAGWSRSILVTAGGVCSSRTRRGGRLLFSRRRQLFTVPVDGGGNPLAGDPTLVTEAALMNETGVPFLAVADSGDMIFLSESDERQRSLIWVDRNGQTTPVTAPPRA